MGQARARVLKSETMYAGPVFGVRKDRVVEPGGVTVIRDVVTHSGSVVLLPLFDDGRVLLVRQYRHAVGSYLWELVAGRIEPRESPLAAAKRELLEETGYSAGRWKRILRFWASPGFVAEAMSLYLAQDLRSGVAQPEDDEAIDFQLMPLKKAVAMVLDGAIQDAKTIAGVLWLDRQSRPMSRKT